MLDLPIFSFVRRAIGQHQFGLETNRCLTCRCLAPLEPSPCASSMKAHGRTDEKKCLLSDLIRSQYWDDTPFHRQSPDKALENLPFEKGHLKTPFGIPCDSFRARRERLPSTVSNLYALDYLKLDSVFVECTYRLHCSIGRLFDKPSEPRGFPAGL
jgi:hypothetical protein